MIKLGTTVDAGETALIKTRYDDFLRTKLRMIPQVSSVRVNTIPNGVDLLILLSPYSYQARGEVINTLADFGRRFPSVPFEFMIVAEGELNDQTIEQWGDIKLI